ncbi:MAG: winged helix-turn-helix transcriptional regulator [Caulobacteraceae bacterium]|nr:winged helix-turn-helix transcriptional regulator [Caulobacteraceae bacterium]
MASKLDGVLEALAEPTRREIFERVVIRPRRLSELVEGLTVSRPAVSHHVKILRQAGLVHTVNDRLEVVLDVLPSLRTYFDRLWLEASLGDTWITYRRAENNDLGL